MPNQESQSEFTLVEQAMGKPSGWIVYWGITVLFIFLIVCLSITALVSYPDILKAKATIYTNRPPVEIVASRGGILAKVWATDKKNVLINEPLAVFETAGNWNDILTLDTALQHNSLSQLNSNLKLGALNSAYQAILQAQKQLHQVQTTDITFQKTQTLGNEVIQIKKLNASLIRQKEIFEEELANIQNDFERSKSLFESNTISKQELEKVENIYLQNKRQLENMQAAVISNTIRIQQIETQVLDLKKGKNDAFFEQKSQLKQCIETMRTAIATWKEKNLVLASVSGVISMPLSLEGGQSIDATVPLMIILPQNKQKKISIAKANLSSQGIGKLMVGQQATIYFDNYPSAEYGTIKAKVVDIALIPQDETYVVTLHLPDTLVTNYGIRIPRQQNMQAAVVINTQDYTILERIFSGLIDVLKN